MLGHSCGGIQERAYATGFDGATGAPLGDVYMSTRCGGSGRAGPGVASASVPLVTGASVKAPGAPSGVRAHWTAPGYSNDQLVATWKAPPFGDSPADRYRVVIVGSDGGGTFTQTVAGAALSATFTVSDTPDWTIRVRAHDAAGWGPRVNPIHTRRDLSRLTPGGSSLRAIASRAAQLPRILAFCAANSSSLSTPRSRRSASLVSCSTGSGCAAGAVPGTVMGSIPACAIPACA